MKNLLVALLPWVLTAWYGLVLVWAHRAAHLSGRPFLQVFLGAFGILGTLYWPLLSMLAVIGGPAAGLVTHSVFIGWYAGIGLPLSVTIAIGACNIRRVALVERSTEQALMTALPHRDYFWVAGYTGIAVDVAARQVALACGQSPGIKTYRLAAIRQVRSIQPNLAQSQVYGHGVDAWEARQQASRDNLRAQIDRQQATGLDLELDDLAVPSLHIPMPYRGAEQWVRLFEQWWERALAPCASPTRLPAA